MRSAYVEIFADPRADLPSAVGPAGSSTTCPRLASREYCRPTVAGDMEITDSMGNASTKRNGKERTKIERRRQRVTESSDLFFILLFFWGSGYWHALEAIGGWPTHLDTARRSRALGSHLLH